MPAPCFLMFRSTRTRKLGVHCECLIYGEAEVHTDVLIATASLLARNSGEARYVSA